MNPTIITLKKSGLTEIEFLIKFDTFGMLVRTVSLRKMGINVEIKTKKNKKNLE